MRYFRWILVVVLVAFALFQLAPKLSEFSGVIKLKGQINVVWIMAAILAQAGQYIGDGWLSQILLRIVGIRINIKNTLRIASLNVFAAHIMPLGQAGVVAATFYFYRRLGADNSSIIFLTIAWSTLTNIVLATIFAISIFWLPEKPTISFYHPSTLLIYTIGVLIVIGAIFYLFRKSLFPNAQKRLENNKIYRALITFKNNIGLYQADLLKSKLLILEGLMAAVIYHISNVATLVFSFLAIGYHPNLAVVTFAYTVSLVAGWLTLAPAGIGATEAALVLVFLSYDFNPAITLGAVLIFRLISFWLPIPLGSLSYLTLNKQTPPPKVA